MTLLIILGVLFAALAITVTLVEKSSFRMSETEIAKWSKWIWPLVAVLLVLQLVRLVF